jgi:hypothetical protein
MSPTACHCPADEPCGCEPSPTAENALAAKPGDVAAIRCAVVGCEGKAVPWRVWCDPHVNAWVDSPEFERTMDRPGPASYATAVADFCRRVAAERDNGRKD